MLVGEVGAAVRAGAGAQRQGGQRPLGCGHDPVEQVVGMHGVAGHGPAVGGDDEVRGTAAYGAVLAAGAAADAGSVARGEQHQDVGEGDVRQQRGRGDQPFVVDPFGLVQHSECRIQYVAVAHRHRSRRRSRRRIQERPPATGSARPDCAGGEVS